MIKLPVVLNSVRDLQDRSCKLSFVSQELNDKQFVDIRNMRLLSGKLVFTVNDIQFDDLEKELADMKEEFEGKTPSKRLRSVLFVYWKQNEKSLNCNFQEFYRNKMESIIQAIKNKLDD